MKKIICLLSLVLSSNAFVYAIEAAPAKLDLTISEVKSFRIDKRVVRTILYNRVDPPFFQLELIKAPRWELLKTVTINSIAGDFENRHINMDFSKSTAVNIENIRAEKNSIVFNVGYTAAEHTAPYIYSSCRIDIDNDAFSGPVCQILKWGGEKNNQVSP